VKARKLLLLAFALGLLVQPLAIIFPAEPVTAQSSIDALMA